MKQHFIQIKEKNISTSNKQIKNHNIIDVALIGGGIMSATLGTYLTILEPNWTIHVYERLEQTAQESSNAWNNAGTGHAAFCELNYTTHNPNGSINITNAININESFEISRQFWSYLVQQKILNNPRSFINNVPHISLVWNKNDIIFLRKRFMALKKSNLFTGMEYSEDPKQIYNWIPLMMEGRDPYQKLAATRMSMGTDVNFGEITQQLLTNIQYVNKNFFVYLQHEVIDIKNDLDHWILFILNRKNNTQVIVKAKYIFIGSGGASLKLVQKAGIPEIKNYAGFPVGGQFLVTNNIELVNHHAAKVYGKSPIGTPPMSVPHMDIRIIDGLRTLLFGPFATCSSKFLKYGSWLDLFCSLNIHNIVPMIYVGLNNFKLIKYLASQLILSKHDRLNALRKFYPQAKIEDWYLMQAGQRVQIIKRDKEHYGVLKFGTEIVSSADGSLTVLLGASPGASTAASIMLLLLSKMFKKNINSTLWQNKLKEIIPSYGRNLNGDANLINEIRYYTCNILGLTYIPIK